MTDKKSWSVPQLTVHGTVEAMTLQQKNKSLGNGDDVNLVIDGITIPVS
jgi:hypothetical protein